MEPHKLIWITIITRKSKSHRPISIETNVEQQCLRGENQLISFDTNQLMRDKSTLLNILHKLRFRSLFVILTQNNFCWILANVKRRNNVDFAAKECWALRCHMTWNLFFYDIDQNIILSKIRLDTMQWELRCKIIYKSLKVN